MCGKNIGTIAIKKTATQRVFFLSSLIFRSKTIAVNRPINNRPNQVAPEVNVSIAPSRMLIKCHIFAQPKVSFEYPLTCLSKKVKGWVKLAPHAYAGKNVANKPIGRKMML